MPTIPVSLTARPTSCGLTHSGLLGRLICFYHAAHPVPEAQAIALAQRQYGTIFALNQYGGTLPRGTHDCPIKAATASSFPFASTSIQGTSA